MPITQERMLAVLDEARSCEEAFRAFRDNVRSALSAPNAATALAVIRVASEMTIVPAMTQCAVERSHFQRTQRGNARNAARMRRARSTNSDLDAGVPSTYNDDDSSGQQEEK
jgi:hypothetical protein